jgi:glycosyltransferase involved in cell wall biosynthesis
MSEALVSVIIPAYNADQFVGDAISSVLTQSHENLELIVVDDGSTDGTAEIAEAFGDPRLRVLRQPNSGPARARNLGLALAMGQEVAFLDADDYWLPNKLDRQLRRLEADEQVSAVGCLMHYRSSTGRVLGVAGQAVDDDEQERIARGQLLPFPLSSILFRRSTLDIVGEFDESLRDGAEDLDLMTRVAREGRFICVDEVLGVYRIHPGSLSVHKFALQRAQTRFVRARLSERENGADLSWEEFASRYRPSLRQRYDDLVRVWYRSAGLNAAERRWSKALLFGLLAGVFGPRYTLKRFNRQRRGLGTR